MLWTTKRDAGPYTVDEQPDQFRNNLYYCAKYKDEPYAWVHLQLVEDIGYIHLSVVKYTSGTLREMRKDLEILKKYLKASYKINRLLGTHPHEGSDKWAKFLDKIGFDVVYNHDTIKGKVTYKEC